MNNVEDLKKELNKINNEIKVIRSELSRRTEKQKDMDALLTKKSTELKPFKFDLIDYILDQGHDIFTEKWEKFMALSVMTDSIKWKNVEYRARKAEYDKIKIAFEANAENIQKLKKKILFMSNLGYKIRSQIESLNEE